MLCSTGRTTSRSTTCVDDACIRLGKPSVYCGVVASYGMTHTVRPGITPCLRCIMGELPTPGTVPTCDTTGIVGPIVALMGSCSTRPAKRSSSSQAAGDELNDGMIHVDLWDGTYERFELGGPRPDCPTCGQGLFEFLNPEAGIRFTSLCGRDAVQVSTAGAPGSISPALAERLRTAQVGTIRANPYLVRADIDGYEFTIFPDGRAIIKGTDDEAVAATLYARYVGM